MSSRAEVSCNNTLNGQYREIYFYEETSGRLTSVLDMQTGEVNEFEWKPEGTLARWTDPNADYERVFSYDEEGRLTKIERDNGPSVQTAYEYSYTGDGIRHMKKDYLANKEYRYGCSIDCGGTPLRVYSRELGSQGEWNSVEDYMNAPTFVWYNHSGGGNSDYAWLPGHWMSDMEPPGEGSMFYQDAFGVIIKWKDLERTDFAQDEELWVESSLTTHSVLTDHYVRLLPSLWSSEDALYHYYLVGNRPILIFIICGLACVGSAASIADAWIWCMNNPRVGVGGGGCKGVVPKSAWWVCMLSCAIRNGCGADWVRTAACVGCMTCICAIPAVKPFCMKIIGAIEKVKVPRTPPTGGR